MQVKTFGVQMRQGFVILGIAWNESCLQWIVFERRGRGLSIFATFEDN